MPYRCKSIWSQLISVSLVMAAITPQTKDQRELVLEAVLGFTLCNTQQKILISKLNNFRYLSESPIHFSSTCSALSALSASHKFLCCGLSTLASDYLARRLSLSNVLMVLQELTLHCPREQENIPVCAPPKRAYNSLNDNLESVNLVDKDILGKK